MGSAMPTVDEKHCTDRVQKAYALRMHTAKVDSLVGLKAMKAFHAACRKGMLASPQEKALADKAKRELGDSAEMKLGKSFEPAEGTSAANCAPAGLKKYKAVLMLESDAGTISDDDADNKYGNFVAECQGF